MGYVVIRESRTVGHPVSRAPAMPDSAEGLFTAGRRLGRDPGLSLEFVVDCPADEHPGHFFDGPVPLVTPLLVEVLRSGGIDNFELFPATLVDPKGEARWGEYLAFNALGLIDATCHETTEATVLQPAEDGQPERIRYLHAVIDPDKVRGSLMFRDSRDPSLLILDDGILARIGGLRPPEGLGVEFERLETVENRTTAGNETGP